MLYEMLTGYPPYYPAQRRELFDKIRFEELKYPPKLSEEIRDLLAQLLMKKPRKRLGSGPRGANEIKEHPWFASIRWKSLLLKKYKPYFIPKLKGDDDIRWFD